MSEFVYGQSFLVPDDAAYTEFETSQTKVIASEKLTTLIPQILDLSIEIQQIYTHEYRWRLDDQLDLVLASPQNQIPNAFVTPERTLSVFYSGAGILDEFAIRSWLYVLLSHELVHLYQLNVKSRLPQLLRPYLGNVLVIFTPVVPLPIFIAPNILTPTALLEGNAVLNEGRFGFGGRLYSGSGRAMTLALMGAGLANPMRLINDHLRFPYGSEEKYLVGGYFQAYLAERFGVEKVNSFFAAQAERIFLPIVLNKTFNEVFGVSFYQLVSDFNARWQPLITKQQTLNGEPLFSSLSPLALNHTPTEILFLTTDLKAYPRWHRYSKNTKTWQTGDIDVPFFSGLNTKLFDIDGRIYVAAAGFTKPTHYQFGLFTDAYDYLPEHLDRVVMDRRAGHELYVDAKNTFQGQFTYRDNKSVGALDSAAILDEEGNYYHFQQTGRVRTLMRNREALASYSGFFGKLTEVDKNNAVYFIAATESGATLFRKRPAQKLIERCHHADTIIDARLIDDTSALVVIASSTGYQYFVAPLNCQLGNPYDYTYSHIAGYEQDLKSLKHLGEPGSNHAANKKSKLDSTPSISHTAEPYQALRQLQFDTFVPSLVLGENESNLLLDLNWVDPIFWNSVRAFYKLESLTTDTDSNDFTHLHDALVSYTNSRYRVRTGVGYFLDQSAIYRASTDSYVDRLIDHQYFVFANLPLVREQRHSVNANLDLAFVDEDQQITSRTQEWRILPLLTWRREVSYPLSYLPFRLWEIRLGHEVALPNSSADGAAEHVTGMSAQYAYDLGSEWVIGAHGLGFYASGTRTELDDIPTLTRMEGISANLTNSTDLDDVEFQEFVRERLSITKVIHRGFYFYQVPIGLRRFAIGAFGSLYQTRGTEFTDHFQDYGVEASLELLLAHRLPFRVDLTLQTLNNSELENYWTSWRLAFNHVSRFD